MTSEYNLTKQQKAAEAAKVYQNIIDLYKTLEQTEKSYKKISDFIEAKQKETDRRYVKQKETDEHFHRFIGVKVNEMDWPNEKEKETEIKILYRLIKVKRKEIYGNQQEEERRLLNCFKREKSKLGKKILSLEEQITAYKAQFELK